MSQINGNRPGEKMAGASYAHRFSLYFGNGWGESPDKKRYDFMVIGHYTGKDTGRTEYPRFSVECIKVETLPFMDKEAMANLMAWLLRAVTAAVGMEVINVRRELLLQVEKVT